MTCREYKQHYFKCHVNAKMWLTSRKTSRRDTFEPLFRTISKHHMSKHPSPHSACGLPADGFKER